ncbi:MucR family transcriptional regulator [Aminobacter aminovorans]|uniref:MucR family transcriptional regulator n=1 Tax=Aminobacter TaxID=31988 RepID=UPI00286480DA|nr:MucR family transcriptional regulator [Aminobacter aminovorans]MDR7222279.1 putative transcriptional regulator [Aminobacter aminovorans]
MKKMLSVRRGADISHVELTARFVSAYLLNNAVPLSGVGDLIEIVHKSFVDINIPRDQYFQYGSLRPAVPIKGSVTVDYIICLEDGRKFKSIKNHISQNYNLTPDEYRAKWRLSSDYPMVAPNYSALRSRIAKELGLGRRTKKAQVRQRRDK